MSVCEVMTCKSRQGDGRIYHRFPKDLSVRQHWCIALARKSHEIKQTSVVCSKHFHAKDYLPGRKRLSSSAVPALWLNRAVTKERKSNKTLPVTNCGRKGSNTKKPSLKNSVAILDTSVKGKYGAKPKHPRNDLPKIQTQSSKKNESSKDTSTIKDVEPVKQVTPTTKKNKIALRAGTDKNFPNIIKTRYQRIKKPHIGHKTSPNLGSKTIHRNEFGIQRRSILSSSSKKTTKVQKELKTKKRSSSEKSPLSQKFSINNQPCSSNSVNSVHTNFKCQKSIKPDNSKTNEISSHKNVTNRKFQENVIETTPAKVAKSLKRHAGSEVHADQDKIKKKKLLLIDTSNSESNELSYGSETTIISRDVKKESKTIEETKNISNIEEKILEMQTKIKNLEMKSILDEKRIETFKNALIQQRKNDLKIIMDERENELLLRMDHLYLDYDPERICLLCLLLVDKKASLTSLVWPQKNQILISLIKNTIGIQIDHEEGLPSGICHECLQQIKRADWIRRRMTRSNSLIKKFFLMKKSLNENNPGMSCANSPVLEKLQLSDDLFEEELTDALKIEDVFSLENSSETAHIQQVCVKEEMLEDDEEIAQVSLNPIFSAVCPKAAVRITQECQKCNTIFTNRWSLRNHFRYCNKTFQCSECNKRFWNKYLFKLHKQRVDTCICVETQRFCYECQIVFRWKWQLVFHVLQHRSQPFELFDLRV